MADSGTVTPVSTTIISPEDPPSVPARCLLVDSPLKVNRGSLGDTDVPPNASTPSNAYTVRGDFAHSGHYFCRKHWIPSHEDTTFCLWPRSDVETQHCWIALAAVIVPCFWPVLGSCVQFQSLLEALRDATQHQKRNSHHRHEFTPMYYPRAIIMCDTHQAEFDLCHGWRFRALLVFVALLSVPHAPLKLCYIVLTAFYNIWHHPANLRVLNNCISRLWR